MKLSSLVSLMALSVALTSCGGESDGTTSSGSGTISNSAPTVDAGDAQSVSLGAAVSLDATASDGDGDTLTYAWSQTSGTAVTLSSTTTEDPTFTAPSTATNVILELTVSDGNFSVSDSVTISVATSATSAASISVDKFIVNTTERSTEMFTDDTLTQGVLYDVQLAVDQTDYIYIETEGIPKFDVVITQDQIDDLNARPRAASADFATGSTTANAGDTVVFGADIGFTSNTASGSCDNGGAGYWPPGPVCPEATGKTAYITTTPTPNNDECETGLGVLGFYVNGASIYGWGDGMSYSNANEFYNLAPFAEQYDIDICLGHAAMLDYHLHNYSQCMADLVGDDGTDHSPIIGFGSDGYPVYGPYESSGTLALSGWSKRDYGAATTAGGCATTGERTCILVDAYDLTAGVTTVSTQGPDIGEEVTTPSGNPIDAVDGYYFEDYYVNDATPTGIQLDEHNGHNNNDGRGYHYHHTWIEESGVFIPSFPFTLGPRFYGDLPDNASSTCDTGTGGMGGPP